jgi:quinoprotein glucose dehydrogenase
MVPPPDGNDVESGVSGPNSGSEFTPIVVNGVMYFGSPFGRVVALDATTGKELWALKLRKYEQTAPRGIAYWPGDKTNAGRLVVTLLSNRVFTVDPKTGAINSKFGEDGILNLRTPEVMGNFPNGQLAANAMPVLYRNLMIIGSRGQENPRSGPRGDVRAFDIVTGKLVWKFNAIPEPGEKNFGTWGGDSWKDRAGVNVWNSATVDERRGIVYLGFGSPAFDRDGTDRPGAGLYGTSLVAVDARSGKYLWHFQTVHHDIWDTDMPSVPTLMDVRKGGRVIPAVSAMTKTSLLFLLDRVTGKPIYDVVEKPVPPSTVPGETAWPTQPFPVKPEPLARQSVDLTTEISDVTPDHQAWCKRLVSEWKLKGAEQFTPIGYNEFTVHFPGIFGGMDWWGGAFDKRNGYYIANVSNQASIQMLRKGRDGKIELGVQPGTWFANPLTGMPCQQGPWGELMAVDVSKGEIAWRVPLGVTDSLPADKQLTGRPMMGGPVVTAGGVVFVAATDDKRFRAFDVKTGKLLWETRLEAAGHATPLTYQGKDGKQYVAIIATGGTFLTSPSTSDNLVVYALP